MIAPRARDLIGIDDFCLYRKKTLSDYVDAFKEAHYTPGVNEYHTFEEWLHIMQEYIER